MLLLSVSEFRANVSKYLAMAMTEKIAIRSKAGIFNITLSEEIRTNPSPSNDTWFEVPENLESIDRGKADVAAGRTQSWEDVKDELGL